MQLIILHILVSSQVLCAIIHLYALYLLPDWQHELFVHINQNVTDLSKIYKILEEIVLIAMLVYQVYFLWWRKSQYLKFINRILPFVQSSPKHLRKNNGTFLLLCVGYCVTNCIAKIIDELLYKGGRRRGGKAATFVLKLFGLQSLNAKMFSTFYLVIKYTVAVVETIVSTFHMFQHGIILSALLGIKQVWLAYQKQITQPGVSFQMVNTVRLKLC